MNTSRRDVLKAGMSLLLPTGVSSSIPESVIGRGGVAWDDLIMCGGNIKFEDFLNYYRGEEVFSDSPSDIERRDIIKLMLRECLGQREMELGGISKSGHIGKG